MKTTIFTLLLLVGTLAINGQNTITGTITDESNDAIFFATVALYNAQDSSLVKAESTDDNGNYKISNIIDGTYYLTASMLSYADQTKNNIELPAMNEASHDLQLSPDANLLTTIEIKEKAPLLEQKADKLIVNVDGNITNTGGNLLDVMRKVPGMLVVRDRLSLAGSGTPTILLNGKTTQYMDVQALLRDMPGDNIKKVEIIHQPGAEYEAAGSGPIINIILKKNSLFGTNGTVSIGVGRGNELWDYNTGIQLSHYAGSFNISGGIGYAQNAWAEEINLSRRLNDIDPSFDGTYTQTSKELVNPDSYRGNVRMDWDLTERHRLGMDSKYYKNNTAYVGTNETNIDLYQLEANDYRLDSENDHNRSWTYRSLNPYYIFEIDTAGQKLELDLSYANYGRSSLNTLTTVNDFTLDTQADRYNQPGDTKIFATTLDYTVPLNKIFELKSGVKYSMANLDNNLIAEQKIDNTWENNALQSNHYLFDETIRAAYSKLNWTTGKWSGTAGLRYEHSNSVGTSLTTMDTLTRPISQFFPSFSLAREIAGPIKSSITYSRRIERPRYSSLNSFIFYLDPFTSDRGNPNLLPQLTHSGKLTFTYEGQPFFNVEYKKSSNAIVEVTEQEKDNQEAYKIDVNFDSQEQFSAMLILPLSFIPGIDGYIGAVQSYTAYDSPYIGNQFNESQWNTTGFMQINFELPGEISGELGGWYTSANQEGIFKSEYLYGSSFGLSKKFLDNKLKVNIGAEDFINRFWHASVDYQQDMDLMVRWQAPSASVKVSYKFGNQHLKSKKKTTRSASEELRRAEQGK